MAPSARLGSGDFERRHLANDFSVQDPVLGAAAVAFCPLQGYLLPKLQRIIRRRGRERLQKMRRLSDRIGETIPSRRKICANRGASPYQLADIAADRVDYRQAVVADASALEWRIAEVLRLIDLDEDVYLFGLRGRVDLEL